MVHMTGREGEEKNRKNNLDDDWIPLVSDLRRIEPAIRLADEKGSVCGHQLSSMSHSAARAISKYAGA